MGSPNSVSAQEARPPLPDIAELSIEDIKDGISRNDFLCVDVVQTYYSRIQEVNDSLHAVIDFNTDAFDQATALDESTKRNEPKGRLHGVPILVKDVFSTNDKMQTTAGSFALEGARLGYESTVIRKLREAGAIILGTTNLSEWGNLRGTKPPNGWSARGGQCYGVYYGHQDPSGSSSGSSVAARIGLAAACLGTENNGSITLAASKSAAVGLKPTVGLTSRFGMLPANHFQDDPGPITKRVKDAAEILEVIAGIDEADPLTRSIPTGFDFNFTKSCKGDTLKGTRIAIPRTSILDSTEDQDILTIFNHTVDFLKSCGVEIIDNVEFPSWTRAENQETLPFVLGQLKKSINQHFQSLQENPHHISNLSDLIGFTKQDPREKYDEYEASTFTAAEASELTEDNLSELFKRRFRKGSEIQTVLDTHDCEAMVVPAFSHNPADLGQCPVISVTMGFFPTGKVIERNKGDLISKGPGIPVGLLFIGRRWDDAKILGLAHAYEQLFAPFRKKSDKPIITPRTELRDIVRQRESEERLARL